MSEIKNPFLDNNVISENQKVSSLGSTTINPETVELENSKIMEPENNTGTIEIKNDNNVLKKIIIVMIILFVMALLGWLGYSLLGKYNNSSLPNESSREIVNTDSVNFEMKGREFKTSSIVIE